MADCLEQGSAPDTRIEYRLRLVFYFLKIQENELFVHISIHINIVILIVGPEFGNIQTFRSSCKEDSLKNYLQPAVHLPVAMLKERGSGPRTSLLRSHLKYWDTARPSTRISSTIKMLRLTHY